MSSTDQKQTFDPAEMLGGMVARRLPAVRDIVKAAFAEIGGADAFGAQIAKAMSDARPGSTQHTQLVKTLMEAAKSCGEMPEDEAPEDTPEETVALLLEAFRQLPPAWQQVFLDRLDSEVNTEDARDAS